MMRLPISHEEAVELLAVEGDLTPEQMSKLRDFSGMEWRLVREHAAGMASERLRLKALYERVEASEGEEYIGAMDRFREALGLR